MSIESGLYSFLTSKLAITNLVGTNIYPQHLPESATYPALVYSLISNPHEHVLTGSSGIARARVQFDVYSNRLSDCVEVAEALRQELHGYRGDLGGETILSSTLAIEQNMSEPPEDGSDEWTYRRSIDYILKYREAIPTFP